MTTMPAAPQHITATALRDRGWAAALIRDHLGDPDLLRPNPLYRSTLPCRLYTVTRVKAAEQSPEWQAQQERTRKRQASAQVATATKRAKLLAAVETLHLDVPRLDRDALTRLVCDHYNERQEERGRWDYALASAGSDAAFLRRITVNYLRHALTSYHDDLARIYGRVGVQAPYQEISRKVYAAIADAYPALAAECERQLTVKVQVHASRATGAGGSQ